MYTERRPSKRQFKADSQLHPLNWLVHTHLYLRSYIASWQQLYLNACTVDAGEQDFIHNAMFMYMYIIIHVVNSKIIIIHAMNGRMM